jgi:RNA polymerase sigma-70 factor (ECF subfamily)
MTLMKKICRKLKIFLNREKLYNTDEAIVKRILKGDGQAFEELICKYQKTVFNICLRFMRDEQDALDMTQEVLVSIYNNIEKFKFKSKFSTRYTDCVLTLA